MPVLKGFRAAAGVIIVASRIKVGRSKCRLRRNELLGTTDDGRKMAQAIPIQREQKGVCIT